MKLFLLLLTASFLSLSVNLESNSTFSIEVKFTNIRNSKGRIQMQIYRSQEAFASENYWKQVHVSKKELKNKTLNYTFSGIPSGTYGIAILDDENENGEMDYKMLLPAEGYGFSDFYHTSWSRPTFSEFKFSLNANKSVTVKVKY